MSITRTRETLKAVRENEAFPANKNETGIIERFRAGDGNAANELFNIYFDRLYSLAFYQVGKNQAAAEDIIQETFLSAVKSARKFNGDSHIYTWLVGIAHHKIADHHRQVRRERKNIACSTEDPTLPEELADECASAAEMIESAEVKVAVEQALNRLPVDYHRVLRLKYIEERPVSEICQKMKRSPKSIEGLLARARKVLKENMGQPDEE